MVRIIMYEGGFFLQSVVQCFCSTFVCGLWFMHLAAVKEVCIQVMKAVKAVKAVNMASHSYLLRTMDRY